MDEERIIAYCDECGNPIYDDETSYVGKDGEHFCSMDCILSYFEIDEVET